MTLGFDGQAEEDVMQAVRDIDDWVSAGLDKQFSGVAAGNAALRNEQLYKLWFEEQVRGNPNWLIGLEFVEGGGDEVQHYMRVSGVTGRGVDWRQFASELALQFTRAAWQRAGQMMPVPNAMGGRQ